MIFKELQQSSELFHDAVPYIMEGQVVSTADPDQMGRVRVWVPSLDGESFDVEQLPWADYASPFMGFTVDYPAGGHGGVNSSDSAYGFWAIPKIGATVLVFCINADPTARCYFASIAGLHRNRSLPAGRNVDNNGNVGPFGDAEDASGNLLPIQPAYDNLRAQFQNKMASSQAQTRGAYERQVAQSKDDKDGTEGYSSNPADPSYLDPQTYCLITPGRHGIIMQDDPKRARLRLKTADGNQIIFDDANERIYMSTAQGRTWVELDQDGHVHIFGAESVSMRSGKDVNIFADGNINLEAGGSVNVRADKGSIKLTASSNFEVVANENIIQSACGIFDLDSETSFKITATANIDLKAGASMAISSASGTDLNSGGAVNLTGAPVNLNGPAGRTAEDAACATEASSPTVVPGFEPWTRPVSSSPRGPNWKE